MEMQMDCLAVSEYEYLKWTVHLSDCVVFSDLQISAMDSKVFRLYRFVICAMTI